MYACVCVFSSSPYHAFFCVIFDLAEVKNSKSLCTKVICPAHTHTRVLVLYIHICIYIYASGRVDNFIYFRTEIEKK